MEEIAVTAAAQIHKLGVVLEEMNKRLGIGDDALPKWDVKRESCCLFVVYVIQIIESFGLKIVQYSHFGFFKQTFLLEMQKLACFKCTILTTQYPLL